MVGMNQQKTTKNVNTNSILSYEEIVQFLDSCWSNDLPANNDRMKKLDKVLGNPAKGFKSIVVAGDNGKSITINFIAQLLKEEKINAGSFYSPHVNSYAERFSINNKSIDLKTFCEIAQEVMNSINQLDEKFHAIEVLTAMAFLVFKKNNVAVGVFESINNSKFDPVQLTEKNIVTVTRLCNENDEVMVKNLVEYVEKDCWLVSADQSKANLQMMESLIEPKKGKWAMPIRKLAALEYPFEQLHGRCAALAERACQLMLEEMFGANSQIIESSLLLKPKGQRGRPTLEAKLNSELNPKRTIEDFWKETNNSLPGRFQLLKTEKPLVLLDNASNLDAFNNLFLGIRLVNYTHQLKGLVLIVAADNDQLFDTEFLRAARYFFKKTSGQVIFCPSQKSSLELKNKGGHFDAERIANEIRSFKVKAKSAKNLADAYSQALKAVDAQNGLIVIAGSTSVVQEFNKLAEQK